MKLVDLLVRELPEWLPQWNVITQDLTSDIEFLYFDHNAGEWELEYISRLNELSADYKTAIVTKEQWENAKDGNT